MVNMSLPTFALRQNFDHKYFLFAVRLCLITALVKMVDENKSYDDETNQSIDHPIDSSIVSSIDVRMISDEIDQPIGTISNHQSEKSSTDTSFDATYVIDSIIRSNSLSSQFPSQNIQPPANQRPKSRSITSFDCGN